ncbi:hypothetical protein IFM89_005427 [Coptis chinensis]|uniref:Uncharacterized protein n=1 Tax=Coptis chinensis TaxID=261450 RepID=A0A835MBT3_9MAGN|nr:hypothetical protein IFM89_005427 [Coptis chinensis]
MSFRFFNLAHNKSEIESRVHAAIDKFPLRSLAVAYQEVPDQRTESPGGSWHFVGLMPLFDSGDTIRRALDLGVNVKMITGGRAFYLFFKVETYYGFDCDQLAIAKKQGRLGMGTNMYPSSALLSQNKDVSLAPLPVEELIEKADGFAGVFPGTIMTISKDRVKPSPLPDSWKLAKIFAAGIVLGSYLAIMTVIFFWAAYKTDFFLSAFKVPSLRHTEQDDFKKLASAVYLQIATLLAVYVNWAFAAIEGIGWGWAGVIWLYNIISYIPPDILQFIVCYALSGRAWNPVMEQRIAFTRQKNFGKEACELKWVHAQRSLHGLHSPNTKMFGWTELHTLKGSCGIRGQIEGVGHRKNSASLHLITTH